MSSRWSRYRAKANVLAFGLSNMIESLGNTESLQVGLVVNGGLAAIGGLLYFLTTGVVAAVGAALAVISIGAILKWVIGL